MTKIRVYLQFSQRLITPVCKQHGRDVASFRTQQLHVTLLVVHAVMDVFQVAETVAEVLIEIQHNFPTCYSKHDMYGKTLIPI